MNASSSPEIYADSGLHPDKQTLCKFEETSDEEIENKKNLDETKSHFDAQTGPCEEAPTTSNSKECPVDAQVGQFLNIFIVNLRHKQNLGIYISRSDFAVLLSSIYSFVFGKIQIFLVIWSRILIANVRNYYFLPVFEQ